MDWSTVEVLEYHNEIKVFQAKLELVSSDKRIYLNTFEMRDLDVCQRNDQERCFAQIDKTISRRLQQHIRSIRNTRESQIPEGNVDLNFPITLAISLAFTDPLTESAIF